MLIACDNKGCMQSSNALLNVKTLKVICGECGQAIKGVSEPMKRTLKSFGQILRDDERKAFMMACKNCNANREVVLDNDNNTVCRVCQGEIKVHAAMKQAIMEVGAKLSSLNKEDTDEATTEAVEAPATPVKKPRTKRVKKEVQ